MNRKNNKTTKGKQSARKKYTNEVREKAMEMLSLNIKPSIISKETGVNQSLIGMWKYRMLKGGKNIVGTAIDPVKERMRDHMLTLREKRSKLESLFIDHLIERLKKGDVVKREYFNSSRDGYINTAPPGDEILRLAYRIVEGYRISPAKLMSFEKLNAPQESADFTEISTEDLQKMIQQLDTKSENPQP